jgi:hypothetical protein
MSMRGIRAKTSGEDREYIHLSIRKEDLEAFCSASGLFKPDFLLTLAKSEKDLKKGRLKKRKSLTELVSD